MFAVVVHTPDVVGERMAGPGIRAWHFAGELAKHFPTILICKREGDLPGAPAFRVAARGSAEALVAMKSADVLIGQPARGFRRQRRRQRIVYDLFDPVLLELREMYGRRPSMRQRVHLGAETLRVRRAVSEGDLLIVATPKQRELYAKAAGPVIEIPFGIENVGVAAPEKRDNIVLWGGGMWEWLDPGTAVEAVVGRAAHDLHILTNRGQRGVRRGVVVDDDLVGQTAARRGDRLEAAIDPSFAVPGHDGDRQVERTRGQAAKDSGRFVVGFQRAGCLCHCFTASIIGRVTTSQAKRGWMRIRLDTHAA